LKFLVKRQGPSRSWCTKDRANQRTSAPAPDVTKAQATMAQKHRRFKVLFGPNNTRRRETRTSSGAAVRPCRPGEGGGRPLPRRKRRSRACAYHARPAKRICLCAGHLSRFPAARCGTGDPHFRPKIISSEKRKRAKSIKALLLLVCTVVFTSQGKQTCTACPCLACPCLNGQKVFTLVQPLIRQACRVQTRRDLLCSIL
jgi:hypothetical protein